MKNASEKDVDCLNTFLKGELSAVETYRQCIEKIDDDPLVSTQLRQLMHSHQQRAELLHERIRVLGGVPATSSGLWGAFAKLVQGGAGVLGKATAISALEEGEDYGKKLYKQDAPDLSPSMRAFVERDIIPEQRRTHDALSALQQQV